MARDDRVLFIVNPVAGGGRALTDIPKIYEAYGEDFEYEVVTTMRPGHAFEIARDATSFSTVVAVGGDGTVHEVINGLMTRPADDRPMFSVIPAGSGNDYANALGIPTKTKQALKGFLTRAPRKVDLIKCNDEWVCDSFALGIDARIANGTTALKETSPFSGFLLYFHSLINTFVHDYTTIKATVTLDDAPPFETEFLLMASTKGPTYGGGFKITPESTPESGVIETCALAPVGRVRVLGVLALLMGGHHAGLSPITMGRHQRVRIESDTPMMAALDGETRESTVYDLTLHAQVLEVK